jgi:hypothetical protein
MIRVKSGHLTARARKAVLRAFPGPDGRQDEARRYLNNSDLMMIGTTLVTSITRPMST